MACLRHSSTRSTSKILKLSNSPSTSGTTSKALARRLMAISLRPSSQRLGTYMHPPPFPFVQMTNLRHVAKLMRGPTTTDTRTAKAISCSAMLATSHLWANARSSHATSAASTGILTASTLHSQILQIATNTVSRRVTGCVRSMLTRTFAKSTRGC